MAAAAARNEILEPALRARIIALGLLPYRDPVSLIEGIAPHDVLLFRGWRVSRAALYNFVQFRIYYYRDVMAPVRLFDGTYLTDDERAYLLEHPPGSAAGETDEQMSALLATTTLTTAKRHGGGGGSYLQRKIAHNMHEMKAGHLKGGAGRHPMVHSRDQALAISYAQARRHAAGRKK